MHTKEKSFYKNQTISSKTFSLKNEGFRVLKNEKGYFLFF